MLPEQQNFFIERLRKGKGVVVRDLKSGHVPFATVPEKLACLTGEIVRDLRSKEN
jgi:stalled ribosome alternative rescue factor ArfA